MTNYNDMKKIIKWLAKVFKVDITVEKIVYRDKIVEVPVEKFVSLEGEINGDLTVKGNLLGEGSINVTGGVSCYK